MSINRHDPEQALTDLEEAVLPDVIERYGPTGLRRLTPRVLAAYAIELRLLREWQHGAPIDP